MLAYAIWFYKPKEGYLNTVVFGCISGCVTQNINRMSKYDHVFLLCWITIKVKRGYSRFTRLIMSQTVLLKQASLSTQWHLTYLDTSKLTNWHHIVTMQQNKTKKWKLLSVPHWVMMPVTVFPLLEWHTGSLPILTLWGHEYEKVANIAINAWFMIHHVREAQGLEHKTVWSCRDIHRGYTAIYKLDWILSTRSQDWYHS